MLPRAGGKTALPGTDRPTYCAGAGEIITVGVHEIIGLAWRWVLTRDVNDTTMSRESNATAYSHQPKLMGRPTKSDFKVGGGSFTLKDANQFINLSQTTLATCSESSSEGAFMQDLKKNAGCVLENGKSLLGLKLGYSTREFHEWRK